jgi:hypothetical protein
MTPCGEPWSTLGQTLPKTPGIPLCPPMSAGIFAAFSKFDINTSNSPNTKVVYFVEGHNFLVDWHLRFEV